MPEPAAGDLVGWFKDKIPAAFNHAKDIAVKAFNKITAPIRALVGFVQDLIDKISNIHWPEPPGWVKDAGSALSHLLPRAVIGRTTDPTTTSSSSTSATPGQTVNLNITINGAVDPMSTARQINSLLGTRARVLGIAP